MSKRSKKINRFTYIALIVLFIGMVGVCAQTMQVVTVKYSLASTKSVTSSAVTANYNNQKFVNGPTKTLYSATQGTYLRVKANKKGALGIYSTKHTVKFENPRANTTASTGNINLPAGTYKYEVYNYGMELMEGNVTVNIIQ